MLCAFKEITFDMYYRQYWQDPRLSFSNANLDKMVITDMDTIGRVWQPDTFLVNEIKVENEEIQSKNTYILLINETLIKGQPRWRHDFGQSEVSADKQGRRGVAVLQTHGPCQLPDGLQRVPQGQAALRFGI